MIHLGYNRSFFPLRLNSCYCVILWFNSFFASSGTLEERNSCRNSILGRGRTPKQPQGVLASINDSIEAEEIMSL